MKSSNYLLKLYFTEITRKKCFIQIWINFLIIDKQLSCWQLFRNINQIHKLYRVKLDKHICVGDLPILNQYDLIFFYLTRNLRAQRHDGAADVGSVAGATATTSMASDVSRTAAHPLPAPPSALQRPLINIFLFFFSFFHFLHFSTSFCQH